jgi:hypothetical protein
MRFECVESKRDGGWAVEATNYESEGEVSRVLFTGANDEQLAKEYAQWKNASAQPQHQPEQRKSEA